MRERGEVERTHESRRRSFYVACALDNLLLALVSKFVEFFFSFECAPTLLFMERRRRPRSRSFCVVGMLQGEFMLCVYGNSFSVGDC